MDLTEKIRNIVFAVGLFTALIGGHLTASYFFLFDAKYIFLENYALLAMTLIFGNLITFFICFALQLTQLPQKNKIMKAAFSLLLNIPIAIIYLLIIIRYGT